MSQKPVHRWMFQEDEGSVASDSLGTSSGQIANVYWSYPGLFSKSAPRISGQDDSYIDFPAEVAQFGVKDFTIAFWVSTAETLRLLDLIGNRTADSHGNFVSIRMTGESDGAPPGQITAEIDEDGNGKNYAFLQSKTTGLNDSQWHYVVLVREGPALHLFVDGFLEDSKTATGIADLNNGNPLRIGRSVRSTALRGAPMAKFDSVEIFDFAAPPVVLSQGEFALLAAALQPPLQGQLDALIKGLKVAVIRRQAFTRKLAEVEIDLHRSQATDDKTSAIGAAVAVGGGAILAITLVALLLAPATGGASLALEEAGLAAEAASLAAEGATLTAESAWAGAPASMTQGGIFAGGGLQLGGKIAAAIGAQMSADESEAATKDVQEKLQEEDVFLQNITVLNNEFQRQLEIAYAGLQASWPSDHEGDRIPTLDEFFKIVRAVRHIPQANVNEVQLWLQRGGHIVSTGLFVAGSLDRGIRGVLTAWGTICTLARLADDVAKQVVSNEDRSFWSVQPGVSDAW
ncbi:MAG: LamG domain-containing protein [Anaerolineales bacterium]|nr:LamG domain-containing protein [Anaerolineales bacterium]